ncbi:hypothetical protein G6F17_009965 [Rhizopus arrhizus]|nr:hypothetical protein G6F17_009965 [Rhizopus arrhizus]KAG0904195.1 hypothetical protein G6F34_000406 [Rhizopus arrhizus]KAG0939406.1 hypothetical protein G6F30_007275 [Rhizopus arrhizus]KAG1032710.1 hypothetical protein G6F25_011079 [Rhizopus arrhizus]KAG1191991.1 hypothetical protein G6F36_001920 [Rhizopus arrhizus]
MNEGLLSVKNASGRHVSLLNHAEEDSKRKYRCCEPGCNKSFTTSGHLARHNRIHTGEKNFPCLFPGCQSRFSRQDNMMQHYRTHMSPKSRRSQKKQTTEETRPKPRLHAHQRIRSDSVQIQPPLTIDQHLSNYHQSLRTLTTSSNTMSPTLSSSSSTSTETINLFYQHRPLTWPSQISHLPYTLLHPHQPQNNQVKKRTWLYDSKDQKNENQDDEEDEKDQNENDLLQLAHIVSTFG